MILEIESIINKGEFKGKKVSKILSDDKQNIFKMIKEGILFSDDVLEKAGIKKKIHSVSTVCSVVEHDKSELTKKLEVDTIDVTTLINEIIITNAPKLPIDDAIDEKNIDDEDDDFDILEDGII